ncbi:MAG: thioredoxin domain-containing protein [Actinomycetales bacterium]
MANRLADATSPYLRQHQENPVDWWPWGDEAWAEAERRDVPVLVSVGYAACHWCHVMAHESFEDEQVAAYLNEHFVSIKVDREERPDVDAAYMAATQALTGSGGWPMTVFALPDGRPFYAATYLPPRPVVRGGQVAMPSFDQVLHALHEAWTQRRQEVVDAAAHIAEALTPSRTSSAPPAPTSSPSADVDTEVLEAAVASLRASFDPVSPGFETAPKFPPSTALEFLLLHAAAGTATGDEARAMASGVLESMARGGMHDQLAGGFARYSVDRHWVVPHFEKMLYDNALLLRAYLQWWRLTRHPLAERVVRSTVAFLLTDLRTPEGGFASSLDADTVVDGPDGARGVEGATYVWSPGQLAETLGPNDAAWAGDLLQVTEEGTFEHGTSTLQLRTDPDDWERWERVRAELLAARRGRPQPARDDKVVTAWNALAVGALAEAGAAFGEAEWVAAAAAAADLLVARHVREDGGVARASLDGRAGEADGRLEDVAELAHALLVLHGVTGEEAWFQLGRTLAASLPVEFRDEQGVWHDTAPGRVDSRLAGFGERSDPTDTPTPAGASAAARALLTLAALTGDEEARAAALAAVQPALAVAGQAARFVGSALAVAARAAAGPLEVAVLAPAADDGGAPATAAFGEGVGVPDLVAAAMRSPLPLVLSSGAVGSSAPALLAERPLLGGEATAYVCRRFVCQQPVSAVGELNAQLLVQEL